MQTATEIVVTWKHAVIIWWAFTWRAGLLALAASVIAGVAIGALGFAIGVEKTSIVGFSRIVGFLIGTAAIIYAVRVVLTKQFRDFRIALLRDHG